MSNTVAVFGPSGMLGRQVCKELGERAQPVYRRMVDLTNKESVIRNLDGCEAVINCAGMIPMRDASIIEMIYVNAVFPHVLASTGIRTVLVSTDCVFSGRANVKYSTYSAKDSSDYYGMSKSLGEVVGPNVTVVRSSFIGCDHGFLHWLLAQDTIAKALGTTQQVKGWKNAMWTGSTVQEVAKSLVSLLDSGIANGLVHLATEQVISKHDLALKIIELNDLNLEVVPEIYPTINRALKPTHLLPDIDTALAAYECRRTNSLVTIGS